LTVSAARFTPGLIERHTVQAKQFQKKRQTKPIEISRKALPLKELSSDAFGIHYAKRSQFRVAQAATF
jgi:hypothetical protein